MITLERDTTMPRRRKSDDLFSDETLANSRHPKFGLEVRRILGYGTPSQIHNRAAQVITGVNYVTISTMANGVRPEYGTIIKFAIGMRANINRLLALADYPVMEFTPDEFRRLGLLPKNYSLTPNDGSGEPVEEESPEEAQFRAAVEREVSKIPAKEPALRIEFRKTLYSKLASFVPIVRASITGG